MSSQKKKQKKNNIFHIFILIYTLVSPPTPYLTNIEKNLGR